MGSIEGETRRVGEVQGEGRTFEGSTRYIVVEIVRQVEVEGTRHSGTIHSQTITNPTQRVLAQVATLTQHQLII